MEHFADRTTKKTIPIVALAKPDYSPWLEKQAERTKNWLRANEFRADEGQVALCPRRDGTIQRVVLGLGSRPDLWSYARLPEVLPRGRYAFETKLDAKAAEQAALAWALATYRFERYRSKPRRFPTLVWPEGCDRESVEGAAEGSRIGRDLINTPAGDMGPAELAAAAKEIAERHGAKLSVIEGKALLDRNYPAIHAVGRASTRAPRLVDFRWGSPKARKLTLVGKGVCFDTGGLDLKNAAGMKLMKKDMGGAASVLGLAHMVMAAQLDVRLRVLIPAVENAVSGDAYHPGDVLQTRKGTTVEVGNTDAEGRLILCDALTEADSEKPDLLIDFATLTGAARIALGTELPALFCNDQKVAGALLEAGEAVADPLWPMPLHEPYRRLLDSDIADLSNISRAPQGGAITAALFLAEFVGRRTRWAHVDTMGWSSSSRPGRPVGGEVYGIRATFDMLATRYGKRT
jgi:leucyl aminopeptidase